MVVPAPECHLGFFSTGVGKGQQGVIEVATIPGEAAINGVDQFTACAVISTQIYEGRVKHPGLKQLAPPRRQQLRVPLRFLGKSASSVVVA